MSDFLYCTTKSENWLIGPTALEKWVSFCYNKPMKTLYDVQQLLKQFGLIIYMGKRLYDIEVMQIELSRLYEQGLVDREAYLLAQLILRREHRLELEHEEKTHGKKTNRY